MLYRLTYAFDKEEVYSEVLECEEESILGVYEHAVQYLEQQYGPTKVLELVGLSLLLLGSSDNSVAN